MEGHRLGLTSGMKANKVLILSSPCTLTDLFLSCSGLPRSLPAEAEVGRAVSVFAGGLPVVLVLLPDGESENQAPDRRTISTRLREVGDTRGMVCEAH